MIRWHSSEREEKDHLSGGSSRGRELLENEVPTGEQQQQRS